MSNPIDLSQLLKQAEQMKKRVQEAHELLKQMEIVGGEDVVITMNGQHQVLKVTISTELLQTLLEAYNIDIQQLNKIAETFSQIIAAAINDAVQKVNKASQDKLGELAAEMQPDLLSGDSSN